jgi:hypothetical protein
MGGILRGRILLHPLTGLSHTGCHQGEFTAYCRLCLNYLEMGGRGGGAAAEASIISFPQVFFFSRDAEKYLFIDLT